MDKKHPIVWFASMVASVTFGIVLAAPRVFADGACCEPYGECSITRDYECQIADYHDGAVCEDMVCPTTTTTTTTTLPPCGNGVVDAGEQCDDGNADDNDCCPGDCQLPAEVSCTSSGRSGFLLSDDLDDSRDKLVWGWKMGGATSIEDFGDPGDSTDYTLCIESRAPLLTELVAQIPIAAGSPPWSEGPKSWTLSSVSVPGLGGITRVVLKSGIAGKAAIRLKAAGAALPSIDLGIEGPVRVLLRSSTGECWSSGLMPVRSARGTTIKAGR